MDAMRTSAGICCCLILLFALAGLGETNRPQDAAPPAPPPPTTATSPATHPRTSQPASAAANGKRQRVVLRVNRDQEVKGFLQMEDGDVVVVRDLQGNLQSFAKSRAQIVRLVEPDPGQSGLVVMNDGQVRQGIIIKDDFDEVIIEIEGIRANLKRSTVDHVVLSPTVDELYEQYKKTLQPGDHDAHFTLCRWLFEQGRYQLARDELLDLLEKAELPEARRLLNIVQAQLKLQAGAPPEANPNNHAPRVPNAQAPEPDGDLPAAGPVRPAALIDDHLLTNDDVNLIRVYEIDFDHPPRVTITPDTVRALIEKYGTNSLIPASQTGRNALFRAAADNPLQIVRLMFELRARDLYPQIQVNSEPYALNLFRRRVHDTWLINNCATNSCHGSPFAGRFYLHLKDSKDDRVRYTNFLILERLQLDPDWPLINYGKPDDSLIIQYGLPRELARKPHPRVDGWKAAFSATNPRLRQEAIEWIGSMMQPRPEYPVDYQPPQIGQPAASRPAGEPAAPTGRVPR